VKTPCPPNQQYHARWRPAFAHPRLPPYIKPMATDSYIIKPDPLDPRLTERVTGIDQTGAKIETS